MDVPIIKSFLFFKCFDYN